MNKTFGPTIFILVIFFSSSLFLSGCIKSQPSKFYVLTPYKYSTDKYGTDKNPIDTIRGGFINKDITIGLGPVSIAKYLDRSQLVVRLTPNQIRLEDFHLWAGSPRDDIPAILLENLTSIMGVDTIYKYPWQRHVDIDYQIVVEIIQLDGKPGESVRLVARWEILKSSSKSNIKGVVVKSGKADFTETVAVNMVESESGVGENLLSSNRFDSFAAAQSRALGKLSIMIAQSLADSV